MRESKKSLRLIVHIGFLSIALPFLGFFSPFPHGTFTLLVIEGGRKSSLDQGERKTWAYRALSRYEAILIQTPSDENGQFIVKA